MNYRNKLNIQQGDEKVDKMKSIDELEKELMLNGGYVTIEKEEVRFAKAWESLICNPNFTSNEVRVYLAMKLFVPDSSQGYFDSYETLVKQTGISRSTIKRIMASLEEKGAVYIVARYNIDNGQQMSNLVVLNAFDEYTGKFSTSPAWDFVKGRYPNKSMYLKITEEGNRKVYTPVTEIVNGRLVCIGKVSA